MRVPLDWLAELVEIPADAEGLAARLTSAGFEVEKIDRIAFPEGVVAGSVVSTEQIEGASDATLCRVDAGAGRILEVVCGAPDVVAGGVFALALPGAVLPEATVRPREMRGRMSEAVLCSERDLGISEDHAGLLAIDPADLGLPPGSTVAPGDPLSRVVPETVVLELAISPNRGDCASILGVAREVSALWDVKRLRRRQASPTADTIDEALSAEIEDRDLCPWYCAQRLHAARGRSPFWMRRRLLASGVRPLGATVDVTNYVMLETGQPLHAFDLDRVRGRRLVARRARSGERLRLLDGRDVDLAVDDLVIADGEGPVALAGVMGGEGSEVGESTARIALESAVFRPQAIRRTARRLGIHTEASFRFERSVDPGGAAEAVARAVALYGQLGARPIGRLLEAGGPPPAPAPIAFVPRRANALLGTSIEPKEMLRRLRLVGCEAGRMHGETLDVVAPTHRHDLRQPADLAEEVARVGGYDAIATARPRIAARGRAGSASAMRAVRDAAAAAGLHEAVLLAFADPADNRRFPGLWSAGERPVVLRNPLASIASEMRTSLVPGLLGALRVNQSRGEGFVPLFSVGTVFSRDAAGRPLERTDLAVVLWGVPPAPIGREAHALELVDLRRVIEDVAGACRVPVPRWEARSDLAFLHPGRAAELRLDGRRLGWAGELHPALASTLDLRAGAAWILEVDAGLFLSARAPLPRYREAPRFPSVERDVALVVEESVRSGAVLDAILGQRHPLVESARLFDDYRGAGIPPGRKSLAYSISYRAADRTLTDHEVNAAHEDILAKVATVVPFERRG
jgi:phenylalanyl-tRNA synthetase beta chain